MRAAGDCVLSAKVVPADAQGPSPFAQRPSPTSGHRPIPRSEASKTHGLGDARLLHKAQALARVSYPDVIQIYEVGAVGDAIYIAMGLVRGKTVDKPRRRG